MRSKLKIELHGVHALFNDEVGGKFIDYKNKMIQNYLKLTKVIHLVPLLTIMPIEG